MGLSTEEMETHISFMRNESEAFVYTSDRVSMTKFDRLCREHPENYSCTRIDRDRDGDIVAKTYVIKDKKLITFRGAKKTMDLTDEQRAELAERIKRIRTRN